MAVPLGPETKIGFAGGGMMAEAIANGLVRGGVVERSKISISEPFEPRRQYLEKEGWSSNLVASNKDLEKVDVIILAVKPNVLLKVVGELCAAGLPIDRVLLVSIAAGVTLDSIRNEVAPFAEGRVPRVVRVMPNTPCLVGAGASAVCGSDKGDVDLVVKLMSAVGIAVEVPEYQIDAVTCVSGSGPAYVYIFIETLADAGVMKGLSRDVALKLATQTVLGGAQMVRTTGEHPAQLRNKVESPGGTTIAAVRGLEGAGLRNSIYAAVEACWNRVKEMVR